MTLSSVIASISIYRSPISGYTGGFLSPSRYLEIARPGVDHFARPHPGQVLQLGHRPDLGATWGRIASMNASRTGLTGSVSRAGVPATLRARGGPQGLPVGAWYQLFRPAHLNARIIRPTRWLTTPRDQSSEIIRSRTVFNRSGPNDTAGVDP